MMALDRVYDLKYERDLHPYHKKDGDVKALHTIKFSVTTHQGYWGSVTFVQSVCIKEEPFETVPKTPSSMRSKVSRQIKTSKESSAM